MKYSIFFAVVFLMGCGGRVANLVPTQSPLDQNLSCLHLKGEKANHISRLAELTGERDDKVMNNLGMLLVSPLFLDLSGTEKAEAEAIYKRNQRIDELAVLKNCPA